MVLFFSVIINIEIITKIIGAFEVSGDFFFLLRLRADIFPGPLLEVRLSSARSPGNTLSTL